MLRQGRARTTSILVRAIWNFKLKVLKYSRNGIRQYILVAEVWHPLSYILIIVQGYYKVFINLKCAICGWLVYVKKNCITYQIFIGIIPTFSENFTQFNQVWPQIWPQMWSEANLRIYTSLDCFIIDSLKKWILEAAIDRLEIQLGTISPFNQLWISSLLMI